MENMVKISKRALKAAEELMHKYRNFTLNEIRISWEDSAQRLMSEYSGMGACESCVLCKASVKKENGGYVTDCKNCIYATNVENADICYGCMDDSYSRIMDAEHEEELYNELQLRADYLESLIEKYKRNEYSK